MLKLVLKSLEVYYFELCELEEARQIKSKYGGTLTDEEGNIY